MSQTMSQTCPLNARHSVLGFDVTTHGSPQCDRRSYKRADSLLTQLLQRAVAADACAAGFAEWEYSDDFSGDEYSDDEYGDCNSQYAEVAKDTPHGSPPIPIPKS